MSLGTTAFTEVGLVTANGDTVTGVTLTSAGAAATAAAGSYTITANAAQGSGLSDYTITYVNTQLTVTQATPTITWGTQATITYGTVLSSTQLDATAPVAGKYVYNPPAGTVLSAGTQTLEVTFTPTDTTNYTDTTATAQITVSQATPTITWATPAAITYGTALSSTQLDATASVAGTMAYTPTAGTYSARVRARRCK